MKRQAQKSVGAKETAFSVPGSIETGKKYDSFQALKETIMIQHLMEKLWAYIVVHNPELMVTLHEDNSVTRYLEEKVNAIVPAMGRMMQEGMPDYAAVELCLNELTAELRPSRYDYIGDILEEEFHEQYARLTSNGLVAYETINLIGFCKPVFEEMGFCEENQDTSKVYYAIIGTIQQYFERQAAAVQS